MKISSRPRRDVCCHWQQHFQPLKQLVIFSHHLRCHQLLKNTMFKIAANLFEKIMHLLQSYLSPFLRCEQLSPTQCWGRWDIGPMHIPVATKGHENLFVALANRKRVDGSNLCSSAGCIRSAPKVEYLIYILPQHSHKKSNDVSSCSLLESI